MVQRKQGARLANHGGAAMMAEEKFRVETDSLGDVQVPVDALYGAQTQRARDNFPISGLRPWRAFIWSIAAIKRAAAEVNHTLGLLGKTEAHAIIDAAKEVESGIWDKEFVVDPFQAGAGTSHHMNANEVIANRANQILGKQSGVDRIHPNDHVNMAQSTNDVIPTSIRLGCLWRLEELQTALQELQNALEDKSTQFDKILKSGRTHLQDAVPIRMGQEFKGYARAVELDLDHIMQAADGMRELGIGGTAAGTGLNAHPEYHQKMIEQLSEITGEELRTSENLFERMQSLADLLNFSAALRTLAVTLTRIANDFRLLSSGPSTGLNELRLPAVQPGSSIMPGKVNPVMAEMLNMAMFHVMGSDTAVALAAQAGQLELNVMMPIVAHNLFEMMQVIIGAVTAFTEKCVVGLDANQARAEAWLSRNAIVVTALNPLIGYNEGASLVKEALERGSSIRQIAMEKALEKKLLHRTQKRPVMVSEVEAALDDLMKLTDGGIAN
jgi:aspartate ammonia-lyase